MSLTEPMLRQNMFVSYAKNRFNKRDDMLIVKERVKDTVTGAEHPVLRLVPNLKRPFQVTKPGLRNHTQKKDYESPENLDHYECTQAELPYRLATALKVHHPAPYISDLCNSPYVYTADIESRVLYRYQEMQRGIRENNGWTPKATMAVLDFEADVVHGTDRITSGAISMGKYAVIAVTKEFAKGMLNPEQEILEEAHKHLKEHIDKRKIEIKVKLVENDLEVILAMFKFAHALKPDFLSIWNMSYDMGKILEVLERENIDPADVFCDPKIPREYRHFKYKVDGESKKGKADADPKKKSKNKHISELWHVVDCPASFYIIDNMCLFARLRAIEQKRTSYKLDDILQEMVDLRKLNFKEADHIQEGTLEWHRFMSTQHKALYCVYNLFDCISMELLDDVIGDVQVKTLPYAASTPLGRMQSNPTRLANAYYFYMREEGLYPCAAGNQMAEPEFDRQILNRRGWPVALDNRLTVPNIGRKRIADIVSEYTRMFSNVADADIASGYPTSQRVMNASRSTTIAEICRIKGIPEATHRRIAVNLTAAPANAVDICQTVLGMPTLNDLLDDFTRTQSANDSEHAKAA